MAHSNHSYSTFWQSGLFLVGLIPAVLFTSVLWCLDGRRTCCWPCQARRVFPYVFSYPSVCRAGWVQGSYSRPYRPVRNFPCSGALISLTSWEYAGRKFKAANQANYRLEVPGVQNKRSSLALISEKEAVNAVLSLPVLQGCWFSSQAHDGFPKGCSALGNCEAGQVANPGELGHKLEFPLSAFGQW